MSNLADLLNGLGEYNDTACNTSMELLGAATGLLADAQGAYSAAKLVAQLVGIIPGDNQVQDELNQLLTAFDQLQNELQQLQAQMTSNLPVPAERLVGEPLLANQHTPADYQNYIAARTGTWQTARAEGDAPGRAAPAEGS